jgi:hypothetical protein
LDLILAVLLYFIQFIRTIFSSFTLVCLAEIHPFTDQTEDGLYLRPLRTASAGQYIFERNLKYMSIKSFIAIGAALCFAIVSFGCGGTATNTTVTTKPANSTNVANTVASSANTTSTTTTNTSATNTETAKTETAGAVTGVPECDEYIQKYEACLTTIAEKNPQIAPGMKTAFEAQRNGFKAATSTPQGKAALAGQCKGFIESAKKSTAQWCTNW